jgi:hypothetical protein
MPRLLSELQRRNVFQVATVYAAVAFIVLQVADLTLPALLLSENVYRVIVWLVLLGFPVALVLSWFFDFNAGRVKLERRIAGSTGSPQKHIKYLSIATIAVLLSGAGGVSVVRARFTEARSADGRIPVAVFPLHAVGAEGAEWSEGVADLLETALDGTEGMRADAAAARRYHSMALRYWSTDTPEIRDRRARAQSELIRLGQQ